MRCLKFVTRSGDPESGVSGQNPLVAPRSRRRSGPSGGSAQARPLAAGLKGGGGCRGTEPGTARVLSPVPSPAGCAAGTALSWRSCPEPWAALQGSAREVGKKISHRLVSVPPRCVSLPPSPSLCSFSQASPPALLSPLIPSPLSGQGAGAKGWSLSSGTWCPGAGWVLATGCSGTGGAGTGQDGGITFPLALPSRGVLLDLDPWDVPARR